MTSLLRWGKLLKIGPSKICGIQSLKNLKWYGPFYQTIITSNFLKAAFHKFYLIHSWILCSIIAIIFELGLKEFKANPYQSCHQQLPIQSHWQLHNVQHQLHLSSLWFTFCYWCQIYFWSFAGRADIAR